MVQAERVERVSRHPANFVLVRRWSGPVPVEHGGTWVELNAGMNAEITKATSLFANIGYQISTNSSNSTAYNGKIGMRMAW